MKKILAVLLSITAIFLITSCEKKDDVKETKKLEGTLTVIAGITDATVKLELENENILGDETIKITVAEKDDSTKKSTKDFVKGTEDYKFESLTADTNYTASITISGDELVSEVADKDFTTNEEVLPATPSLEGTLTFTNVDDENITVVVNLDDDAVLTDEDVKITLTDGTNPQVKDFEKGTTEYTFTGLTAVTEYTATLTYVGDLENNVLEAKESTKAAGVVTLTGSFTEVVASKTETSLTFTLALDNSDKIEDANVLTVVLNGSTEASIAYNAVATTEYVFTGLTEGTSYTVELVSTESTLVTTITSSASTVAPPLANPVTLTGLFTEISPLKTKTSLTFELNIYNVREIGNTSILAVILKDSSDGIVKSVSYNEDETIQYVFDGLTLGDDYTISLTSTDGNVTSSIPEIDAIPQIVIGGTIEYVSLTNPIQLRMIADFVADVDLINQYITPENDGRIKIAIYFDGGTNDGITSNPSSGSTSMHPEHGEWNDSNFVLYTDSEKMAQMDATLIGSEAGEIVDPTPYKNGSSFIAKVEFIGSDANLFDIQVPEISFTI